MAQNSKGAAERFGKWGGAEMFVTNVCVKRAQGGCNFGFFFKALSAISCTLLLDFRYIIFFSSSLFLFSSFFFFSSSLLKSEGAQAPSAPVPRAMTMATGLFCRSYCHGCSFEIMAHQIWKYEENDFLTVAIIFVKSFILVENPS